MSIQNGLWSREYYQALGEFRDASFIKSNSTGRRRRLGFFAFGLAKAEWETEVGGVATLLESGIRYKETSLSDPMTLRIDNHAVNPEKQFIETFEMQLDSPQIIRVYRRVAPQFLTPEGLLDLSSGVILGPERAVAEANVKDRLCIYDEMQRGALGECLLTTQTNS
ncbi:MAG TPA: hypothetical protein VMR34_02780 [Candidatus Saccharimonadales bacterium]|nr:hypothetical protein [Candidatus Saccharimonadales bacterium]